MNIQKEKQLGKRIWSIRERIGIKGNATLKRKLEFFFILNTGWSKDKALNEHTVNIL